MTIIGTISFVVLIVVLLVVFPILNKKYNTDQSPEKRLESGRDATDFTVYDKDGSAASLSDMEGKPTIVNFWATWCGYCVQELPYFNKYYEKYGNKINFMMVDLADGGRETKNSALQFVKKQGYTFPVYFDTQFSATEAYSISSIPMTLIIDKNGKICKSHIGMMSEDDLQGYIKQLTK